MKVKHYDELEWIFYKEKILPEQKLEKMEEHLYECDDCMDTFLSLIDNKEINGAEEIIPLNFTSSVVDNVQRTKYKTMANKQKSNMTFKNIFGYYVAVAAVAIILTWGGFFSNLVDTLPQVANSAVNKEKLNVPNMVFNMSEKIVNKTSNFINEFQFLNGKEELK